MIERTFPTINGVAVSPMDIWLPPSNLNTEKEKNFNNHHAEWTAKRFGRSILFQVFRDLESNQMYLPIDVHAWIHENYAPPKMPEPFEAMEEIEEAFCGCKNLHIKRTGGYILRLLDLSVYQQCELDYNKIIRGIR